MLQRKISTGTHTRVMHRYAVHNRIGTRKVNIFKHAGRLLHLAAVFLYTVYAAVAEDNNFARLKVTDKLRTDRVERTRLGSHDISAVRRFSVAYGSEAVGIAHGNEL